MNPTDSRLLPWVILAVFLLLTAFATQYVWETSNLAERAAFDGAVQATRDAIQYRLDAYTDILTSASGLFVADESVERQEFRAFVEHLNLPHRYPGIRGIGLSLRVPPEKLAATTAQVRKDYPDFRVWPEGVRSEYTAIVMIEPEDRPNRAAIGYDMKTNPSRREAMDKARDSAQPWTTSDVTLVQEISARKQHGFLIYVPLYVSRTPPASVRDRRAELYGYIYAPFRVDDLLAGIFGQQKRTLGFELYDAKETPGTMLYSSDILSPDERPRYESRSTVRLPGRVWKVRFFALHRGYGSIVFPLMTLIGGVSVSVLLFALLTVQFRARTNAERTAEQLRISEGELQAANRAKDEFLATLSHELRTPMTAIMGWSRLLSTGELDERTQVAAIDAIQKSSEAQAQLIDDLLDVSRITVGKMRIEPRTIEIGPVVRAAVEAVVPAADAKGVRLQIDMGQKPVLVSGDGPRLQQVFWNLLTNAVKFTPRGGAVSVGVRSSDEEMVVQVRDTGEGIAPEFLPHVFERFRQADSSTSRQHSGLGLGLAIVRHLVELHGGEVSVASDGLGKGAAFTITLPAVSTRSAATQGDRLLTPFDGERLRGAKVLVVDDEAEVRNYIDAVLRGSAVDVRAVASAAEAMNVLSNWRPDLIISDIGMPGVDGYEFLQQLKSNGSREVPVIAVTAYARQEDRQRAMRAGFDAFVSKPVEPDELRAVVGSVLGPR